MLSAMGYPLFCEKHHFGLRNGLYWRPKEALLHHERGSFGVRNGLFRNAGIRNPRCGTYGMRQ